MKRLLLAPLLIFCLLIADSAFANRSKIKQQENATNRQKNAKRRNKKVEKYINLCNNSELPGNSRDYVYCYKVKGKNREKITAKGFIEAAKELSRERLDDCLRPKKFADSYTQELACENFINEPHTYWFMDEVTKEEYELAEKYMSEYDIKRTESIERNKERFKNTNIKPNRDGGRMNKNELYLYCRNQQKQIGASIDEVVEICGSIFDLY